MNREIVDFFTLHRRIFGLCPNCNSLFRLSDCQVYLRRRPETDWMSGYDRANARLADLEEKLAQKEEILREEAREEGRKKAAKMVRRIDPVFTPRRLNPDDAKVIFHPIDFVVFNGMKERERPIKNIILLDRKETRGAHREVQKSVEKAVEKGRYEWQTLRVADDGTVAGE